MNFFRYQNVGVLFVVTLLALLSAGCSRQSKSPDGPGSSHAAKPNIIDLGVLDLSDNEPSRHELSDGRTAVVTAKVLPDGSLDIGTVIQAPPVDGKRKLLGMPRIITKSGEPVEVMVDDAGLKFTPTLKSN